MGDSMTKFREDNEVENSEQKSLSLEEVKEKVRQIINQSQDLKYDLSFSASGVMDILNSIDDTSCMTEDFESTDGQLNLSHREIIEDIIEEVAEVCHDDIYNCSDGGDDYVDTNNCEFSIYNGNEIEVDCIDLDWSSIAGLISDRNSSEFKDIVDKYCGIDYPFKDGDTYYIICDDNKSVNYRKILTKTWDEESRKNYHRNNSYYKSIDQARESICASLDNNYDDEYVEMEVIHTETDTTSDCEWTEQVYSKEKVKLYDPSTTKYDERLVYMTKRQAEIYSDNLFEQYPTYPFNEGDDYWTIEDAEVVKSCWDEQSEALHRENRNKVYYKTQDDAEAFLVELSKEAIENEVG